jgi:hypothetical protein
MVGDPLCFPPRPLVLQDWPKHWRSKLKRNPGDLSLVTSLVSHLLRYSWAPQTQSPRIGLLPLGCWVILNREVRKEIK